MTPREPDRYEEKAKATVAAFIGRDDLALITDIEPFIDAALRREHDAALDEAAQAFDNRGPRVQSGYEAAALCRALASPAAAPAAETGKEDRREPALSFLGSLDSPMTSALAVPLPPSEPAAPAPPADPYAATWKEAAEEWKAEATKAKERIAKLEAALGRAKMQVAAVRPTRASVETMRIIDAALSGATAPPGAGEGT